MATWNCPWACAERYIEIESNISSSDTTDAGSGTINYQTAGTEQTNDHTYSPEGSAYLQKTVGGDTPQAHDEFVPDFWKIQLTMDIMMNRSYTTQSAGSVRMPSRRKWTTWSCVVLGTLSLSPVCRKIALKDGIRNAQVDTRRGTLRFNKWELAKEYVRALT